MEFLHAVTAATDARDLARRLTTESLPRWCASVYAIERHGEDLCASTVWGVYRVRRETIRGGVRFTLPNCPNALAWTVTTDHDPDPGAVWVHVTINRAGHDPDFVASLENFAREWCAGLERGLPR